ncbi:methyltransferase [Rhodohalobacter sp. 8-1]|uniref:methyltransferase n=1 Tax=Rhodohalobacter sp. 8-1 TaxID=3131972 RepID=UPI0030EE0D25
MSERYHKNAEPEQDSAKRLADSLEPWRNIVPPGPIFEIGAGTGHFTDHIIRMFPNRELVVSDVSNEMIEYAKSRLEREQAINFKQFDAETDEIKQLHYSLICGNHVVHQFDNPAAALEKLALGLSLDGLMLVSFPGEDSFQEWRSTCLDLGIPFTGKPMPGTEPLVIHISMGPVQVDFYEDQSIKYFDDFNQFLVHMSSGGLDIEGEERQLSDKEKNLLNEHWKTTKDGQIGMTFHNVFLAIKRIGE